MATVAKILKAPSPNVKHGIPCSQHTPYSQEQGQGHGLKARLMCIKGWNITQKWRQVTWFEFSPVTKCFVLQYVNSTSSPLHTLSICFHPVSHIFSVHKFTLI